VESRGGGWGRERGRREGGRGPSLVSAGEVGGEGGGVLGWRGGERGGRERGVMLGDGRKGHARSVQRRHRLDSPLEWSIACVGFWQLFCCLRQTILPGRQPRLPRGKSRQPHVYASLVRHGDPATLNRYPSTLNLQPSTGLRVREGLTQPATPHQQPI